MNPRFYKTKKIKGASVIGTDPDEVWFCVRAKNFSTKQVRDFKKVFQSLCDQYLEPEEEIKTV